MVLTQSARNDVDNELLTKIIIYRQYANEENDLAYDTIDRVNYKDYYIKAQATVQRIDSRYVEEGLLIEGDLVGLFRYEYTQDAYGNSIPKFVPKKEDKIQFEGQWFIIKTCVPATNEEEGVIAWDFTASQVTKDGN